MEEGSSDAEAVVVKCWYFSVGRRVSHSQLGVCRCHILVVVGDQQGPRAPLGSPEIWRGTRLPCQDFDRDDTVVLIAEIKVKTMSLFFNPCWVADRDGASLTKPPKVFLDLIWLRAGTKTQICIIVSLDIYLDHSCNQVSP